MQQLNIHLHLKNRFYSLLHQKKSFKKRQIDLVSLEEKIRPQIGEVISLSQLSLIPSKINQLLLSENKFKDKIQKIREETVFNVGNSSEQGAKYLLELKKIS